MAARKRKIRHDEETRSKIQAAHIIRRMKQCFEGEITLTQQQFSCGKLLLDKVLPDLSAIDMSGDMNISHEDRVADLQRRLELLDAQGLAASIESELKH